MLRRLRSDGTGLRDSAPMRLLESDIAAAAKAQLPPGPPLAGQEQAEQAELLSTLVSIAPVSAGLSLQAQLVAASALALGPSPRP